MTTGVGTVVDSPEPPRMLWVEWPIGTERPRTGTTRLRRAPSSFRVSESPSTANVWRGTAPAPAPARANCRQVTCLAEDLPALCVHLDYPLRLRLRLRSTNLLERSLGEVKRRTKVIGRFPGETSCLSLCWAVMDLFIAGARGLGLTDLDREQLGQLRAQGIHQEVVEKSA